jgi:hypothetical protein
MKTLKNVGICILIYLSTIFTAIFYPILILRYNIEVTLTKR